MTSQEVPSALASARESTLRQQIETAVAAASPDPCAIGQLEIQAYGLRQQIEAIRKSAEAAFVASLTSDQQTKYAAFVAANPNCAAFPTRGSAGWPLPPL